MKAIELRLGNFILGGDDSPHIVTEIFNLEIESKGFMSNSGSTCLNPEIH